jgi:hypothetical protein
MIMQLAAIGLIVCALTQSRGVGIFSLACFATTFYLG